MTKVLPNQSDEGCEPALPQMGWQGSAATGIAEWTDYADPNDKVPERT